LKKFKDEHPGYQVVSYVNTTECKKTIMELNNLKSNEVLFVKYDINRTRMVNQVHYNAYNALTGEALDVSICGSEEILYPFNTTGINIKLAKKLFEEYGVDVFNEEDSFFNDNCFRFYDDYQHDVILKDRRNYIFQNVSLCEKNCNEDNKVKNYMNIFMQLLTDNCVFPIYDIYLKKIANCEIFRLIHKNFEKNGWKNILFQMQEKDKDGRIYLTEATKKKN